MTCCDGRITVKKKLSKDPLIYGVICVCGKKLKMTKKQIKNNEFLCTCGTKPLNEQTDLNSSFSLEVKAIQDLLETSDNDKGHTKFQKDALKMLIELIPLAEAKYRQKSGEHSAYALNSLISQARELISDIKAEKDVSELTNRLVFNIIKPAFINITQNVIDTMYYLKKNITDDVPLSKQAKIKGEIDEMSKSIGHYLQETFETIHEKVEKEVI